MKRARDTCCSLSLSLWFEVLIQRFFSLTLSVSNSLIIHGQDRHVAANMAVFFARTTAK